MHTAVTVPQLCPVFPVVELYPQRMPCLCVLSGLCRNNDGLYSIYPWLMYEDMDDLIKSGKFLVCLLLLPVATVCAATGQLLEQLRSDHAALVSAEHDFHDRRERGVLNGTEVIDYAAYVARLHRQVAEDCMALADSGIPAPSDISCLTNTAVLIAPVPVDQSGERTSAEKTGDLEAELFRGMGEFDEMLLREQERIKAATPHAAGGGGGGSGSGGAGGESGTDGSEGAEASGGDGEGQVGEDSGGSPTYGAGSGPGSSQRQGNNGAPPDTPDGNDDDVVARQLREAAEKETDPVLKKKLWEEYRKYKEGTY